VCADKRPARVYSRCCYSAAVLPWAVASLLEAREFCYTTNMAQTTWLNLKNIAIDESDDGLDPNWLLLPYETRLQKNFEAVQRGIKLEEALKNKSIPQKVDRNIHYNILRDAF
jgi:hypothetical protein